MKKIMVVLSALLIGLACVSCSNNSESINNSSDSNVNKVLSTWVGSGAGAGITFTIYSGNTAKATAPEGTWEVSYTGDIEAASGTLVFTVTKASEDARVNVGDTFKGTKTSASTLVLEGGFGTYTKQ